MLILPRLENYSLLDIFLSSNSTKACPHEVPVRVEDITRDLGAQDVGGGVYIAVMQMISIWNPKCSLVTPVIREYPLTLHLVWFLPPPPYTVSLALFPFILSGAKFLKKYIFLLSCKKTGYLHVSLLRFPPTLTHTHKQVTFPNKDSSLPKRNSAIKIITCLPHYISVILNPFLIILNIGKIS